MSSIFDSSVTSAEQDEARLALVRLEQALRLPSASGPAIPAAFREPIRRVLEYARKVEQDVADLEVLYAITVEASTSLENELSMRYDAITTFLANTSHELRTPLNAVIGHSELLLEELADDGNHRHDQDLTRIRDAGRHLLALINGILDLSKVESGQLEICPESVDMADLVRELTSSAGPLARTNSNELVLHVGADVGQITADPVRIRQCLLNLLGNACKFTREGIVTIDVSRQFDTRGQWVVVTVHDTGIGMTPEQLSRIFRPYAQADSRTSQTYGGTGLGLAFTRSLCERMGADVQATSEMGGGSTFTIRFPQCLPDALLA